MKVWVLLVKLVSGSLLSAGTYANEADCWADAELLAQNREAVVEAMCREQTRVIKIRVGGL